MLDIHAVRSIYREFGIAVSAARCKEDAECAARFAVTDARSAELIRSWARAEEEGISVCEL